MSSELNQEPKESVQRIPETLTFLETLTTWADASGRDCDRQRLGYPAFIAMVAIYFLMVLKPALF